jgi:hypothetical protein
MKGKAKENNMGTRRTRGGEEDLDLAVVRKNVKEPSMEGATDQDGAREIVGANARRVAK